MTASTRCNEYALRLPSSLGNDTIEARDGEIDSITCGIGTDRVVADAADVVDASCETVERAPAGGPAPGGGPGPGGDEPQGCSGTATLSARRGSPRRAAAKGLRVTVRGASRARSGWSRARGRDAPSRAGRATATCAAPAAAVLRPTAAGRKLLRRKRRVALVITGAGARTRVTLTR